MNVSHKMSDDRLHSHLDDVHFKNMRDGHKTAELRPKGGKDWEVGEVVTFSSHSAEHIRVCIKRVVHYQEEKGVSGLRRALDAHLAELVPGMSIDEAQAVYLRIYGNKLDKNDKCVLDAGVTVYFVEIQL